MAELSPRSCSAVVAVLQSSSLGFWSQALACHERSSRILDESAIVKATMLKHWNLTRQLNPNGQVQNTKQL